MKSVLISIQPRWCEKIATGEKTIEVRKTKPKLKTPFKCYIYQTKLGKVGTGIFFYGIELKGKNKNNGKVIGEFICDEIDAYKKGETITELRKKILFKNSCLTGEQLYEYAFDKTFYVWHISQLKIYDKPKELSEFKTTTPCKQAYYFDIDGEIGWYCKDGYTKDAVIDKEKDEEECIYFDCPPCGGESNEYEDYAYCLCNGYKPLKRPPQSWCYAEELKEN